VRASDFTWRSVCAHIHYFLVLFCIVLQVHALENVVNEIKNSGNKFFKARNFVRANAKYRKALRYIEW
jgi:uncharacterized protein HemY